MAVIVRKQKDFDGTKKEVEVYKTNGLLTKKKKEQAEKLDQYLSEKVPELASRVINQYPPKEDFMRHRYELGKEFHNLLDGSDFVTQEDLEEDYIWDGIWYYLPKSIKPMRSREEESYLDREEKRQGFFSLVYEISKFDWEDVNWIQRWHDWYEISSRPKLTEDERILNQIGCEITKLDSYPSGKEFREIIKKIGSTFSTRSQTDTSLFSEKDIKKIVRKAVKTTTSGN